MKKLLFFIGIFFIVSCSNQKEIILSHNHSNCKGIYHDTNIVRNTQLIIKDELLPLIKLKNDIILETARNPDTVLIINQNPIPVKIEKFKLEQIHKEDTLLLNENERFFDNRDGRTFVGFFLDNQKIDSNKLGRAGFWIAIGSLLFLVLAILLSYLIGNGLPLFIAGLIMVFGGILSIIFGSKTLRKKTTDGKIRRRNGLSIAAFILGILLLLFSSLVISWSVIVNF